MYCAKLIMVTLILVFFGFFRKSAAMPTPAGKYTLEKLEGIFKTEICKRTLIPFRKYDCKKANYYETVKLEIKNLPHAAAIPLENGRPRCRLLGLMNQGITGHRARAKPASTIVRVYDKENHQWKKIKVTIGHICVTRVLGD